MVVAAATPQRFIRMPTIWPHAAAVPRQVLLLLLGAMMAGLLGTGCRAGAAPSAINRPAFPQKISTIQRARWIGVAVQGIPPVYGRLLGLRMGQGLLVVMVVDGSPAAKAGLSPGDLIIRVDHKDVDSPMQLVAAANRHVHGKVELCGMQVIRDGKRLTVRIESKLRPQLAGSHLRVERLAMSQEMVPLQINNPAIALTRAPNDVMHETDTPKGVRTLAPMTPMTWTRHVDIYGYVHSTISYGGHNYRILPSTLKTLPDPVRQMVRMLVAQHAMLLQAPPTEAQKLAILKARIAFLQKAQRQVQAERARLLKGQSKP